MVPKNALAMVFILPMADVMAAAAPGKLSCVQFITAFTASSGTVKYPPDNPPLMMEPIAVPAPSIWKYAVPVQLVPIRKFPLLGTITRQPVGDPHNPVPVL